MSASLETGPWEGLAKEPSRSLGKQELQNKQITVSDYINIAVGLSLDFISSSLIVICLN